MKEKKTHVSCVPGSDNDDKSKLSGNWDMNDPKSLPSNITNRRCLRDTYVKLYKFRVHAQEMWLTLITYTLQGQSSGTSTHLQSAPFAIEIEITKTSASAPAPFFIHLDNMTSSWNRRGTAIASCSTAAAVVVVFFEWCRGRRIQLSLPTLSHLRSDDDGDNGTEAVISHPVRLLNDNRCIVRKKNTKLRRLREKAGELLPEPLETCCPKYTQIVITGGAATVITRCGLDQINYKTGTRLIRITVCQDTMYLERNFRNQSIQLPLKTSMLANLICKIRYKPFRTKHIHNDRSKVIFASRDHPIWTHDVIRIKVSDGVNLL